MLGNLLKHLTLSSKETVCRHNIFRMKVINDNTELNETDKVMTVL